ncbi:glycosyltransferase [Polaribacter atrinae]|uniref:glycosyltransferase n=1 Tax=Polaribacter atrinae TaxID=1333662 RepID=UPI0030F7CCA9
MIPKTIHYCWFGNKQKSQIFSECLTSWKKYCPDYKIIEWNEINSEQFSNKFYKNALRKKKYAFAADYIRLKVLHVYGGIYLDTDMLIVKPLGNLLKYNFFSGLEVKDRVAYGFLGGYKENHFFKRMIDFYNHTEFDEFNPPIITHTFKNLINSNNLKENEVLLSPEYFYPLTFQNREKDYKLFVTEKTYAVHLWDHSWKIETKKGYSSIFNQMRGILLDFFIYGYSFEYFLKYSKEFLLNLYRMLKYKQY